MNISEQSLRFITVTSGRLRANERSPDRIDRPLGPTGCSVGEYRFVFVFQGWLVLIAFLPISSQSLYLGSHIAINRADQTLADVVEHNTRCLQIPQHQSEEINK